MKLCCIWLAKVSIFVDFGSVFGSIWGPLGSPLGTFLTHATLQCQFVDVFSWTFRDLPFCIDLSSIFEHFWGWRTHRKYGI